MPDLQHLQSMRPGFFRDAVYRILWPLSGRRDEDLQDTFYPPYRTTNELVQAVLALVDDFAHFCADHSRVSYPASEFLHAVQRTKPWFAGFDYDFGIGTRMHYLDPQGLQTLLGEGYHLVDGQLPTEDDRKPVLLRDLDLCFMVKGFLPRRDVNVEGRLVLITPWFGNETRVSTQAGTIALGHDFMLQRINSPVYESMRGPVGGESRNWMRYEDASVHGMREIDVPP